MAGASDGFYDFMKHGHFSFLQRFEAHYRPVLVAGDGIEKVINELGRHIENVIRHNPSLLSAFLRQPVRAEL